MIYLFTLAKNIRGNICANDGLNKGFFDIVKHKLYR